MFRTKINELTTRTLQHPIDWIGYNVDETNIAIPTVVEMKNSIPDGPEQSSLVFQAIAQTLRMFMTR